MVEPTQSKRNAVGLLVFLGSGFACAAIAFFLPMLGVVAFSSTNLSRRYFGDEGSAWLPISIGVPFSVLVAATAFLVGGLRIGKMWVDRK